MLQLAVPSMRTDRALRAFNASYGPKYKYELAAWRKGVNLYPRDCALLDANDGLGACGGAGRGVGGALVGGGGHGGGLGLGCGPRAFGHGD